jgi:aryl-alcohol dehydrogenase-like predicted oxidoreductase
MVENASRPGFKQMVQKFYNFVFPQPLRYGIGCAWIGPEGDYRLHLKEDMEMLETAYQLGFRYFDTAPYYANSEFVVGEFVSHIPRQRIFLATKFNLASGLTPIQAADHVRKSLEESLRWLQTDYLDLYQIHDVNSLENILPEGSVLEVLRQAREDRTIRFFGLATRWHSLLTEVVLQGEFDTILTYADYTPFNQTAGKLIELADQKGVGVINASPLAGARQRHLDLGDLRVLGAVLKFPLQNRGIDINLTGPANSAELRISCQAFNQEVDQAPWQAWNSSG